MNKPEIAAGIQASLSDILGLISFDRREALRYMGYHGAEPDAADSGELGTLCR